jgi:hypothetical protein
VRYLVCCPIVKKIKIESTAAIAARKTITEDGRGLISISALFL